MPTINNIYNRNEYICLSLLRIVVLKIVFICDYGCIKLCDYKKIMYTIKLQLYGKQVYINLL